MMILLIILSMFTGLQEPPVKASALLGTWKVMEVKYLDKKPENPEQGLGLVFEFKAPDICINHRDGSNVRFQLEGRKIDMDGYAWIVESLTREKMIVREDKTFFVRKLILDRI